MAHTPLLVYSHLRWDFVYQRPQHVMSRIARTRPVLFIEEPVGNAATDTWERNEISRGLCVYRPRLRGEVGELGGFAPEYGERMVALLEQLVMHEGIGRHTAWLYTPQGLQLAHALAPEVLVYDCMDELANFRHASPELPLLERELLRHADVVFTGGPSLYQARKTCIRRCSASRAASTPNISRRAISAVRSRRIWNRCRIRGSATTASSTSASTWD